MKSDMRVIAFHGVITEQLLNGGGDSRWPSRSAGQGWYHHWMWVSTTIWMRVGTPCTYIVQPDIDWTQSMKKGEVIHCLRLTALPGHLDGVIPEEDAIQEVCQYFREAHQVDWLRRLTQTGRAKTELQTLSIQGSAQSVGVVCPPVCTCSMDDLMMQGCRCGAVR